MGGGTGVGECRKGGGGHLEKRLQERDETAPSTHFVFFLLCLSSPTQHKRTPHSRAHAMEAPLQEEDACPIAATPLAAEEVAAADVRREESSRTSSLRGGGGWSGLRPLFLPIKAPPHHRGPTLFRSRLMPRDKEQGHPSSSLNRFSPRPRACQRPRGGPENRRGRAASLSLSPLLSLPRKLSHSHPFPHRLAHAGARFGR